MSRPRGSLSWWIAAVVAFLLAAWVGITFAGSAKAGAPGYICHYANQGRYIKITLQGNNLAGHQNHPQDIIPATQNWGPAYEAIWENGCERPTDAPSPTPSILQTPTPSATTQSAVPPTATFLTPSPTFGTAVPPLPSTTTPTLAATGPRETAMVLTVVSGLLLLVIGGMMTRGRR